MLLEQADAIIVATRADARAKGTAPLAVVVLDAGGNPVAFGREDGCSLFRHDIARAKAMGALGMGADTSDIARRACGNPAFFTSVAIVSGGNLALAPGGVLVFAGTALIGAVGVSGDIGDVDERCAQAGIAAAGLRHRVTA